MSEVSYIYFGFYFLFESTKGALFMRAIKLRTDHTATTSEAHIF